MKAFGCATRFVVAILILCGVANRVNGASWTGQPYNLAIAHGQRGTITCKANATLLWRSSSPTVYGLGNTNNDTIPGYSISESSSGDYNLHFTGNVSSTPTIISCSDPKWKITDRKVHVIVIKLPVKRSTANTNSITCSAEFRAESQWRPYFYYGQTNGSETRVGEADSEGIRTITATFSIEKDSKTTAKVCSIIKFSNSPEDIGKEGDDIATNIPELNFAENGADDPKRGAGYILPWGIALVFAGYVSILGQ